MNFTFTTMTEEDARAIQRWHYDVPYSVYDLGDDDETLVELLNPHSPYVAARNEQGELAGFFAYGTAASVEGNVASALFLPGERILNVGLALRPDLTGQGKSYGLAFVLAGLDYARQRFAPSAFRLFVLTFNERAIRVYERAGFERVGVRRVHNIHGENEFLEMRRPA